MGGKKESRNRTAAWLPALGLGIILTGCVGGGSTTILKGVDVNDGRPGTYSGYTYVPKTYSPQKRAHKHD